MKQLFIFFFCINIFLHAQTLEQCKQRFTNYLNFKGSLDGNVLFEKDAIYLLNDKGQKQLAIYSDEVALLASFFENSSLKDQEQLVKQKGVKKFTAKQRDSLIVATVDTRKIIKPSQPLPLKGYRIALDPGHFGTTLAEAKVEQKFLYFATDSLQHSKDSIKLFESNLTFNTASILRQMLEEQGAEVLMSRTEANYTSFNCTYAYWLKANKQRVLDSLKTKGQLSIQKYNKLVKGGDYNFFWDFFRDYDLLNRADKINRFKPHVTAVIHYNVDEKNSPWKKTTPKDYCMAFIGGAFTSNNLQKTESLLNFLRLLLTGQLERSQTLAAATVQNFHTYLTIPIAAKNDATYLAENCMETSGSGVYCRNLLLCRKINSVLVYGESLYQDNQHEAIQLMRYDADSYGIASNNRLISVAKSYYEAIFQFLKNE